MPRAVGAEAIAWVMAPLGVVEFRVAWRWSSGLASARFGQMTGVDIAESDHEAGYIVTRMREHRELRPRRVKDDVVVEPTGSGTTKGSTVGSGTIPRPIETAGRGTRACSQTGQARSS